MKSFIIKNKAFVSLLTLALLVIFSLSIYIIQKQNDAPVSKNPEKDGEVVDDPNKETEISSLSASYNRSSKENIITASWSYMENNTKVTSAYLYLNDNEGINVTQNRYYDFPQSVYDYPTGDNTIRLVLTLANGKTIEKTQTVFVKYIISAKQEVTMQDNVVNVTLEYVYDASRPVNAPEVLSSVTSNVTYVDTKTIQNGRKIIARSTFAFTWDSQASIPSKFSVRWKFNEIIDSFDFTATKPQNQGN